MLASGCTFGPRPRSGLRGRARRRFRHQSVRSRRGGLGLFAQSDWLRAGLDVRVRCQGVALRRVACLARAPNVEHVSRRFIREGELVAYLHGADLPVLEANQREGCVPSGVVTQAELPLPVRAPDPDHPVRVDGRNVGLAD